MGFFSFFQRFIYFLRESEKKSKGGRKGEGDKESKQTPS